MSYEDKFLDLVAGYFQIDPKELPDEVLTQLYDFFAAGVLITKTRIKNEQRTNETAQFIQRHITRTTARGPAGHIDKDIICAAETFMTRHHDRRDKRRPDTDSDETTSTNGES